MFFFYICTLFCNLTDFARKETQQTGVKVMDTLRSLKQMVWYQRSYSTNCWKRWKGVKTHRPSQLAYEACCTDKCQSESMMTHPLPKWPEMVHEPHNWKIKKWKNVAWCDESYSLFGNLAFTDISVYLVYSQALRALSDLAGRRDSLVFYSCYSSCCQVIRSNLRSQAIQGQVQVLCDIFLWG